MRSDCAKSGSVCTVLHLRAPGSFPVYGVVSLSVFSLLCVLCSARAALTAWAPNRSPMETLIVTALWMTVVSDASLPRDDEQSAKEVHAEDKLSWWTRRPALPASRARAALLVSRRVCMRFCVG
eukprot:6214141-Pleurochrysis_carterae.AAC.4